MLHICLNPLVVCHIKFSFCTHSISISYRPSVLLPDLQNVDITLRILFRPEERSLPWIFTHIGVDFDEKILPSITNEVLKGVVVGTVVYYIHCSMECVLLTNCIEIIWEERTCKDFKHTVTYNPESLSVLLPDMLGKGVLSPILHTVHTRPTKPMSYTFVEW